MKKRTELINGTKYEDFYQGTGNTDYDKEKNFIIYKDLSPIQMMKRLQDLEKRVDALEEAKKD